VLATGTDIEDITRTIWATLFDLGLERSAANGAGTGPTVTSCVHFEGDWNGALVLTCPMALARTLTEQMFRGETAPDLDEVRDALGELANMLGGNVKPLLPGGSQISLPAVAVGSDYELRVIGTSEVARASFTCDGHPLLVTLLERAGWAGASAA
jgi:chemotaxis protein CheX